MHLVCETALVGTKHDGVRGLILDLFRFKGLIKGEQFHVGTTAIVVLLELDFVLDNQIFVGIVQRAIREFSRDGLIKCSVSRVN